MEPDGNSAVSDWVSLQREVVPKVLFPADENRAIEYRRRRVLADKFSITGQIRCVDDGTFRLIHPYFNKDDLFLIYSLLNGKNDIGTAEQIKKGHIAGQLIIQPLRMKALGYPQYASRRSVIKLIGKSRRYCDEILTEFKDVSHIWAAGLLVSRDLVSPSWWVDERDGKYCDAVDWWDRESGFIETIQLAECIAYVAAKHMPPKTGANHPPFFELTTCYRPVEIPEAFAQPFSGIPNQYRLPGLPMADYEKRNTPYFLLEPRLQRWQLTKEELSILGHDLV